MTVDDYEEENTMGEGTQTQVVSQQSGNAGAVEVSEQP